MQRFHGCLLLVLATACTPDLAPPPTAGPDAERGPLGKADLAGTCEDHCGGKSAGACWCDDWCEYFGDCCADKAAICDGEDDSSGGAETSESGGSSDGGDTSVEPTAVTALAAGGHHTCALLDTGAVRCWGDNAFGQLGYGHTDAIGDDEVPATAGDIDLGGVAIQIATSRRHTCALLEGGTVRCWGDAYSGKLGYANAERIGDDEAPAEAGDVDIGELATSIDTAGQHTCAVTQSGALRCWGSSSFNGIPGSGTVGNDETPASVDPVDIGGDVVAVAAGDSHTCALLDSGGVRCFGTNLQGQCAYWNTNTIVGSSAHPSTFPEASLYEHLDVVALKAGRNHTCVRYNPGGLHCWGINWDFQAGYRSPELIVNPLHVSIVNLDDPTVEMALGAFHSCAVLETGAVRCWGANSDGQLGAGHTNVIGDNEDPSDGAEVALLGTAVQLATGASHSCALLDSGDVQCWGRGAEGQLGYASTESLGDDELADVGGLVEVL